MESGSLEVDDSQPVSIAESAPASVETSVSAVGQEAAVELTFDLVLPLGNLGETKWLFRAEELGMGASGEAAVTVGLHRVSSDRLAVVFNVGFELVSSGVLEIDGSDVVVTSRSHGLDSVESPLGQHAQRFRAASLKEAVSRDFSRSTLRERRTSLLEGTTPGASRSKAIGSWNLGSIGGTEAGGQGGSGAGALRPIFLRALTSPLSLPSRFEFDCTMDLTRSHVQIWVTLRSVQ